MNSKYNINNQISYKGFDLPKEELCSIQELVEGYAKKIARACNYDLLTLKLRKARHGKAFLHELKASARIKGKLLNAEFSDYNLYKAIAEVMKKLLHEAEHEKRTKRQRKKC